jgi:hypothetical protein
MTTPDRSNAPPPDRPPFVMPRPQRTGPQRMLATVGRFDDAKTNSDGTNPARGRPLASTKDVIEHAIRVAQEVIDQQIGSGERILRYLRRAPVAKRRKSPLDDKSGASLTERTMAVTNELGVLAIEALETIAESKTVAEVIARWLGLAQMKVDATGGAPYASPAPGPRVEVFVSSRKPAKVEARFFAANAGRVQVPGLHGDGAPAILGVKYLDETVAFRVTIPDDQPAGVYWGVIVGEDQQPAGTIVATVTGP